MKKLAHISFLLVVLSALFVGVGSLALESGPALLNKSRIPISVWECPNQSKKAGIAWVYKGHFIPRSELCFDENWHDYDAEGWSESVPPVLWGDYYGEDDLRQLFLAAVPTNYDGIVLWANEPDRPDQANMTPEECGDLGVWLADNYQSAEMVGPMVSAADNGLYSKDCYDEYVNKGGDPERLTYGSLHIYPRPGDTNIDGRFSEYWSNYLEPTDQDYKQVYVTEVGMVWYQSSPTIFESWLSYLEADDRVARYYVYSATLPPGDYFRGLVDWNTGEINFLGDVFRNIAGGYSGLEQAYPAYSYP